MAYRHTLLALLALLLFSAIADVLAIDKSACAPYYTTNQKQCILLAAECKKEHGILLKWTGKGSRDANGRARGDGGCQCSGYCGFLTGKPCGRDGQCRWNKNQKLCYSKKTGLPGVPISTCPKRAPKPTAKPKTNSPKPAPGSTQKPSPKPTHAPTLKPTHVPTIKPSKKPTNTPTKQPAKGPHKG